MFPLIFSTIIDADDRAFMEELYNKYHKLIYSQIRRLSQDPYEVEEIAQESLLRLIEKVSLLQTLPRDRLVNYIISTARYTAFGYFRVKKRHEMISLDTLESTPHGHWSFESNLEDLVLRKIESETLYSVWMRLKERDQILLNMKYILDYSNEDIADFLM